MTNYSEKIQKYLALEMETIQKLDVEAINQVMNTLEEARLAGKTIYICGNGGSAATASHFVCDFNKGVSEHQEQKYFPCVHRPPPFFEEIIHTRETDSFEGSTPLILLVSQGYSVTLISPNLVSVTLTYSR